MKHTRMKQALLAVAVATAGIATPVMAATPASASPSACRSYLESKEYIIGPVVREACGLAVVPYTYAFICVQKLVSVNVRHAHANTACLK